MTDKNALNEFISSNEPNESFTYQFTFEELKKLNRRFIVSYAVRLTVPLIVILLFSIILGFFTDTESLRAAVGPLILTYLFFIAISLARVIGSVNQTNLRVSNCVYRYDTYNDFFIAYIYRNGEECNREKLPYDRIQGVNESDGYFLINAYGRNYMLRRENTDVNSAFFSWLSSRGKRV